MDVATVVLSSVISVILTIAIMIVFYSKWILPYLTKIVNALPSVIRENIEPYIDEKMTSIQTMVGDSITELKGSFKATSNRLNRTLNQADDYLRGMDIDPDNDEEVSAAREKLTNRYGADVALQVITRLFNSIQAQQDAKKAAQEAPRNDGWD